MCDEVETTYAKIICNCWIVGNGMYIFDILYVIQSEINEVDQVQVVLVVLHFQFLGTFLFAENDI